MQFCRGLASVDSTSNPNGGLLDPQIAIATVAIIGAVAHAIVAILRALQDFRHDAVVHRRFDDPPDVGG